MAIRIKRPLHTEYTHPERIGSHVPWYFNSQKLLVKELLDNAADAAEDYGNYMVEIVITKENGDSTFSLLNKGCISEADIRAITAFEELFSTKYGLKKISRGVVGHGLKIAIMLCFLRRPDAIFVIESGGKRYEISLYDWTARDPRDVLRLRINENNLNKDSTRVTVPIAYLYLDDVKNYVLDYILCNPHIHFRLTVKENAQINTKDFPRKKLVKICKKADFFCYESAEFQQAFEILSKSSRRKLSLKRFVSEFNISSAVKRGLKPEMISDPSKMWNFLKDNAKHIDLPIFNKNVIKERLKDCGYELLHFATIIYPEEGKSNTTVAIATFQCKDKSKKVFCYNGTSLPYLAIYDTKIIDSAMKKLPEQTGLLIIYYTTNPELTGSNKEYVNIPEPVKNLIKDKINEETKHSTKQKNKGSWMKKEKHYKQLIKKGSYLSEPNLLDKDFDRKKITPIQYLFLNDCMGILRELNDMYGSISIRFFYYRLSTIHLISENGAYKPFDRILSLARKLGYISWERFRDDSKPFYPAYINTSLNTPPSQYIRNILAVCLRPPHAFDVWERQNTHVEVWIEKEAMVPIVKPIVEKWNVSLQPIRGYTSVTKAMEGVKRVESYLRKGLNVRLIYLGDFDPSGWMITKNLEGYFASFQSGGLFQLTRLALNPEQVKSLPHDPLPLKKKDPNYRKFINEFRELFNETTPYGYELEAMDPEELRKLLDSAIESYITKPLDQNEIKKWLEEYDRLTNLITKHLEDVL